MNLSKNFTYNELIYSPTASRRGIVNKPNILQTQNLKAVVNAILQPARNVHGPIRVTSGFRCKKLNRRIGGSRTSQHMNGQAVDFVPLQTDLKTVFNWIAFESGLPYDQLIYEFGRWIHVSYRADGNNRGPDPSTNGLMLAYKVGRKTKYERISDPIW